MLVIQDKEFGKLMMRLCISSTYKTPVQVPPCGKEAMWKRLVLWIQLDTGPSDSILQRLSIIGKAL
jgi:hypothetical protein